MKRGNPNLDRDRNTDTTAARKAKLRKAENFQLEIWILIHPLVVQGMSLQQIADWLDAEANSGAGIRTCRGNKWTRTAVRRIIRKWE
jgi:recombinase